MKCYGCSSFFAMSLDRLRLTLGCSGATSITVPRSSTRLPIDLRIGPRPTPHRWRDGHARIDPSCRPHIPKEKISINTLIEALKFILFRHFINRFSRPNRSF